MPDTNIKPTHKPIKTYYAELEKYAQHGAKNEGTVRAAFQNLLQHYCHKSAKGDPVGVIFKTYSSGVKTNRDAWVYNWTLASS